LVGAVVLAGVVVAMVRARVVVAGPKVILVGAVVVLAGPGEVLVGTVILSSAEVLGVLVGPGVGVLVGP